MNIINLNYKKDNGMDNLTKLETELNNLAWHIKVADESKSDLCKMVVGYHVKMAKHYLNKLDNQNKGVIK
tara:strand:+ start:497 stop:706 length:210 start_codon:yes stop_codon:yes gene_type:complete